MAIAWFDANTAHVSTLLALRISVAMGLLLVAAGCGGGRVEAPTGPLSPQQAPHPLVHGIFARTGAAKVDEATFFVKVAERPFVLVGEKHDNDEHHAFEARVVDAVGKKSARRVVMEHFRAKSQEKLDAFFQSRTSKASDLPALVGWEEGWGPFAPFEPVFAAALSHAMPVMAGSFDRIDVRALRAHPEEVIPADIRAELGKVTFDDTQEKALVDELFAAHCGHLPGDFLAPMAMVQHARDALFAQKMQANGNTSAVLLAGKGHTRGDRGVPRFLPLGSFVSVALVEVETAKTKPADYEELATHDYVYFTPKAPADEDPCEAFRHPKPQGTPKGSR